MKTNSGDWALISVISQGIILISGLDITYIPSNNLSALFIYIVFQDFVLPDVRDRQFLLSFHKKAKKLGMDVSHYNDLKNQLAELESDLRRLRDPLALNLPHSALKTPPTAQAPLAKAQKHIKNLLGLKDEKK